jgi:hypothetical protein
MGSSMKELHRFILAHAVRDQGGAVADMIFFKVGMVGNPTPEEFRSLTKEFRGESIQCNPLDGNEHNYIELGQWLGDQGMALMYMGLGSILGIFQLLTPKTMLGNAVDDATAMKMAGVGYVAIQRAS